MKDTQGLLHLLALDDHGIVFRAHGANGLPVTQVGNLLLVFGQSLLRPLAPCGVTRLPRLPLKTGLPFLEALRRESGRGEEKKAWNG